MPLYDLECLDCRFKFEGFAKIADREGIKCTKCGGKTKILLSPPKKDWFRPFWHEDLSIDGPIFVRSKEHYKQLCREHGCYAKIFGKGHNISEI